MNSKLKTIKKHNKLDLIVLYGFVGYSLLIRQSRIEQNFCNT